MDPSQVVWGLQRRSEPCGLRHEWSGRLRPSILHPDDADALGFEVQGRKLLHIKEIGALQVRIALFVACRNRGRLDRGFDAGVREIRFIQEQSSRNLREGLLKKIGKRAERLAEKKTSSQFG